MQIYTECITHNFNEKVKTEFDNQDDDNFNIITEI